ncbi:hypothetical protein C8J56DRAFT_918004 [Mycena floridula]|nr:hypothetical protein C8J56DRAFT_918004 [Mycena floridula]
MKFSSLRALAVAASLLSLAEQGHAFWRLPCNSRLIVERADPIVNPGAVSGHVHTVSGASGFGLNSTYQQMRDSDCTSCMVQQDKSAYWTPALYFQWANGSVTLVDQMGGGLIYYLPRSHPSDTTEVLAFPQGLRMLTGSPSTRSYNASSLTAQAIGLDCLGGSGRQPGFPAMNCHDGLRGEIRFPSCWNGVDIDSPDHASHMAYSDGESGPCPKTHPKRIVTLFYEMMWNVDAWAGLWSKAKNPKQPFVLSMGDSTGYGYHGDFMDGWDQQVLQSAIRTCTDDSGVIELCKIFDLQPDATCQKTPDVNELVTGTLDALPGCNPVTGAGPNATPCKAPTTPEIFTSPVSYTGLVAPPGAQVLSTTPQVVMNYDVWGYVDCYSDLNGGVRTLQNNLKTKESTIEACLDACTAAGYSHCGIEYHGQCWGGNDILGGAKALGYGSCGLTCDDNPLQLCGSYSPTGMELYTKGAKVATSTTKAAGSTTKATSSTIKTTATVTSSAVKSSAIVVSASVTSTKMTATVSTTTKASSTAITVTSVTSALSTSSPTSSSAAAPSSSAPAGKLINSKTHTYTGCFSDLVDGSSRSLPILLPSDSTIEGCLAASDAAGFALAGLSYKGECWAASALAPASKSLDPSKCQMACTGNKAETCGGAAALDIYTSKTIPVLKAAATPDLASVGGYSFSGCYSDLVNNQRSLANPLASNSTIEGCIAACTAAKLDVCGLEYYGECWGSSTGLAPASTLLDASRCEFPCKGNPTQNCGGSAALSVYKLAAVKREVSPPLNFFKRHRARHHFH